MTLDDILKPFNGELHCESFKAVRKHLKMTQEDIAEQLSVSVKTISRYENDHCEIPASVFTMLWALVGGQELSCMRSDHYMRYHNAESLVNSYDRVLFVEVEVDVPYSSIQVLALGVDKSGDDISVHTHQAGDSLEIRGQYSWSDMSCTIDSSYYDDDEAIAQAAIKYFCQNYNKLCVIRGIDHTLDFEVKKTKGDL